MADPRMAQRPSSSRKSRVSTREACEMCREKKAKCDGGKPCLRCQQRDTECTYETRNHQTKGSLRQEIENLKTKQRDQDAIFDALRDMSRVGPVLAQIQGGLSLRDIASGLGVVGDAGAPSVLSPCSPQVAFGTNDEPDGPMRHSSVASFGSAEMHPHGMGTGDGMGPEGPIPPQPQSLPMGGGPQGFPMESSPVGSEYSSSSTSYGIPEHMMYTGPGMGAQGMIPRARGHRGHHLNRVNTQPDMMMGTAPGGHTIPAHMSEAQFGRALDHMPLGDMVGYDGMGGPGYIPDPGMPIDMGSPYPNPNPGFHGD